MRELMASCGPNKHDQVMAGIAACIDNDINTQSWIIGTLKSLGLNPRHVGKMLKDNAGSEPERFWWQRDNDGRFSLFAEGSSA